MATTDPFTAAGRAYAMERYPSGTDLDRDRRMVVDEFAEWARDYLAVQEPTDAECIHVLNVVTTPFGEKPKETEWAYAAVQRCRDAIMTARNAQAGKP